MVINAFIFCYIFKKIPKALILRLSVCDFMIRVEFEPMNLPIVSRDALPSYGYQCVYVLFYIQKNTESPYFKTFGL
jgi:hypothetical protein